MLLPPPRRPRGGMCISGGGGREMREQPFPGGKHPSHATSEMYFNPLPRAASWNVKNDPPRTHAGSVLL